MFIARQLGWSQIDSAAAPAAREAGGASERRIVGRVVPMRLSLRPGRALGMVALSLLCAGLVGCGSSSTPQGAGSASARFAGMSAAGLAAPDFSLRDQHGQLVRLSAERGKFVVITFLYVHCKNVCPVIAQQLNQALRDLGRARNEVRVLAVSVDPKGDTRTAVAHFIAVHRLLPEFLYLTANAQTLERVWKGYHIASTQTGNNLVVGHTAVEILLDRSGRPQVVYDSTVTPQQVVHDLHVLGLQE